MEIGLLIVFVILFSVAFVACFLYLIFSAEKKYRNKVGDIQNFDRALRNFYYYVEKTPQEIQTILSAPGNYMEYSYHFNKNDGMITFSHSVMTRTMKCLLIPKKADRGTLLCVYRYEGNVPDRNLLYFMNPFWAAILNAVPIPYTPYSKN